MSASRLLIPGAKLQFHTKVPLRPTTRSFCSETRNQEYVQSHPEVFTKPSQVQKEVGGSWYLLNSLKKLKDKVFSGPCTEKVLISESLDSREDTTKENISEAIWRGERLAAVAHDELKATLQSSESKTYGNDFEKDTTACPTSDITARECSEGSVRPCTFPNAGKIVETGYGYQQSEAEPETVVIPRRDQETVTTSWEVRNTDERFDTAELDERKSRHGPLDDAQLVEQGNKYQEELFKGLSHLVHGSVDKGGENSRTSDIAGSVEEASIEYEGLPPNKKVVTHVGSNGSSEVRGFSTSDSEKRVLGSANPLDDDTLTTETSSGNSIETSRENSLKISDIKKLIGHVKNLRKDSPETKSSDQFVCNNIKFPHNGLLPNKSDQAVTGGTLKQPDAVEKRRTLSGQFVHSKPKKQGEHKGQKNGSNDRRISEVVRDVSLKHPDHIEVSRREQGELEKQGQQKRQNKRPSERCISEVTSRQMDEGLFSELDESLDSDDGTTKKAPSATYVSEIMNGHENVPKLHDAAFDSSKSITSPHIPLPYPKEALKRDSNRLLFTEKGRDQNDLLVRFVLQSRGEKEIHHAFRDCGPIDIINFINSSDDQIFKNAYVKFKTKDGMRKALAKTDPTVGNSDVVVEAVSPSTYTSNKIRTPNPIGVPGIAPSLVKNPTRTVMVRGLTCNVSLRHLEAAFSFCGACITGFFMGSSSSVAYIEFETENAKEKAIAACSVLISGNKLSILRIDSPSTTVVRLSNLRRHSKIASTICSKYGKVKRVIQRDTNLVDVYYELNEWPVMVNILNSLNGQVVDEHQLIAQPAPIIPVEILKFLWSQPDGRRHVHSVFQTLLQQIEGDGALPEIRDRAARYYEESIRLFPK